MMVAFQLLSKLVYRFLFGGNGKNFPGELRAIKCLEGIEELATTSSQTGGKEKFFHLFPAISDNLLDHFFGGLIGGFLS